MNCCCQRENQVAMDDYYDFEIVNSISTADWIPLMLIISFWLFFEEKYLYLTALRLQKYNALQRYLNYLK